MLIMRKFQLPRKFYLEFHFLQVLETMGSHCGSSRFSRLEQTPLENIRTHRKDRSVKMVYFVCNILTEYFSVHSLHWVVRVFFNYMSMYPTVFPPVVCIIIECFHCWVWIITLIFIWILMLCLFFHFHCFRKTLWPIIGSKTLLYSLILV